MSDARAALRTIMLERGLVRLDAPVELASGELSTDFIDAKRALSRGQDLAVACQAMVEVARGEDVAFNAVGGLTLGADQFAHGVALVLGGETEWFVIRKAPKGRGTNKVVEGADLGPASRVLLVDDVVTTGGSIKQAYAAVRATGAEIVLAMTIVDRGDTAGEFFAREGVPYRPVLTYTDLGIVPVGRRGDHEGARGGT